VLTRPQIPARQVCWVRSRYDEVGESRDWRRKRGRHEIEVVKAGR
jgi:hypothetical protein